MKTPEELAEDYVISIYKFKSSSDWVEKNAFLAGYNAGVASCKDQIKQLKKEYKEYNESNSAIYYNKYEEP